MPARPNLRRVPTNGHASVGEPPGDLATRLAEAAGLVTVVSGHVDRLAVESGRAQAQVIELTALVEVFARELDDATSRLRVLEQQLENSDRMIGDAVARALRSELDRLHSAIAQAVKL